MNVCPAPQNTRCPIPVAFFAPRMRSYENASSSHERLRRGVVLLFPQAGSDSGCRRRSAALPRGTTLRVGMWTLWHDRDLTLTPTGPKEFTLLQTCERCAAEVLHAPATIHAQKDGLNFSTAGKTVSSREIRLSGPVTLTAHGETVTLHDPVDHHRACRRARHRGHAAGRELCGARGRERERPGDSPESLKALAIVVRSFALHEAHGHADYDLCDSTHCQLLHWSGTASAEPRRTRPRWPRRARRCGSTDSALSLTSARIAAGARLRPTRFGRARNRFPICLRSPTATARRPARASGHREITRAELTAALAAHGLAQPGWQNLSVARRGASGRAVTLRLDAH